MMDQGTGKLGLRIKFLDGRLLMQPKITFAKANSYAFFFEDVHLLLINWDRDEKKEIYRIERQEGDTLVLDYPGDLFVEQVLHVIENIFFVTVREGDREGKYALGVYFVIGEQPYGVYYEKNKSDQPPELIFFRVIDDGNGYGLQVVEDEEEHRLVTETFMNQYTDFFSFNNRDKLE
jgi:hypothetical protein